MNSVKTTGKPSFNQPERFLSLYPVRLFTSLIISLALHLTIFGQLGQLRFTRAEAKLPEKSISVRVAKLEKKNQKRSYLTGSL